MLFCFNYYILFLRYKDESQIFTREQSEYDVESDTIVSLIIHNMSNSDSGIYKLTVSNAIGEEATSNYTRVTVLGDLIYLHMEY